MPNPMPVRTGDRPTPALVCTNRFYADQRRTDRWAFVFMATPGMGSLVLYAPTADRYRVGDTYELTATAAPA